RVLDDLRSELWVGLDRRHARSIARHGHVNALDGIVRVAAGIRRRFEGLHVPGGVGRAAAQLVLPGSRVPTGPKAAPAVLADRLVELGVDPRVAAVDADLDAVHLRPARPRAALDVARAGVEDAAAGHEVGDSRRREERPWHDARDRHALDAVRLLLL